MNWLYKVGDNEYHNKLHAIQDNIASANPVTFHAPKEYSSFDFSQEPAETLNELLTEHAKHIRDSHNKVRLYYSGGCDSDLVLRTFVENKIHIDEIICLKCGIPSADFEIDNHAIPYHTLQSTMISGNSRSREMKRIFMTFVRNEKMFRPLNRNWKFLGPDSIFAHPTMK